MKRDFPIEFVYQVFALIIAVILVHAVYVAVIRPNADAVLRQEAALVKADPNHVVRHSIYVIVRDYEQETCFILMLWALSILAYKGVEAYRERRLLDRDLLRIEVPARIGPADTPELTGRIETLPAPLHDCLLARALRGALERFAATRDIQAAASAKHVVCDTESERLESELSIIRYIAWAIPSIGFLGTVRGIGDALGQAHKAVEGDISGVTQSLGVAFNSTFVALLISLVLMFFIYQLQLVQERLVLDTGTYCDHHLIRYLQTD